MNPDIYAYLDKKAVELNGYFFRWNKESDEQTKAWLVLDIFQNTKSLFKTIMALKNEIDVTNRTMKEKTCFSLSLRFATVFVSILITQEFASMSRNSLLMALVKRL